MPLTDVLRKRTGRLARLGIIRLGHQEPNRSGNGTHPVADDHFVLDDARDLRAYFGEAPTALPIHFPYVDFDRNVEAFHRVWAGGICVCQGDGEIVHNALPFRTKRDDKGRVHVYRDKGDRLVDSGVALGDFTWNGSGPGSATFKEGMTVPCPGSENDPLYPHCEACAPSIILKVMIRDERAARFGYYQVATRSIRNYTHFLEVMDAITEGGRIPVPMNAVPFVLHVVPARTMYQDDQKAWQTTERFFLQLEIAPELMRKLETGRTRRLDALLTGAGPEPAPLPGGPLLAPMPEPESEEPLATPDHARFNEDPSEEVIEEGEFEVETTLDIHNNVIVDAPAQEPEPNADPQPKAPISKKPPKGRSWPADVVSQVIDHGHAKDVPQAVGMLNKSGVITPKDALDVILAWCKHYRGARSAGDEPDAAAAYADEKLGMPVGPAPEPQEPPQEIVDESEIAW